MNPRFWLSKKSAVPLLSLRYFRSALLIKSVLSHGARLNVPLLSLRYFRSALLIKSVLSHGACLNVPLHRERKRKSTRWKSGADTLSHLMIEEKREKLFLIICISKKSCIFAEQSFINQLKEDYGFCKNFVKAC